MTDDELHKMLTGSAQKPNVYEEPDYERVHREMSRSGVTLSLLWNEYSSQCRQSGAIPYMYSAFCDRYRDYSMKTKATMHIDRRPGEQMEVDWAGKTMSLTDNVTGEAIPTYIFVSVLPYSGYAYVEAFLNRKQESWITAHVNAYRFFGGSTRILVPDNLKTGVIRTEDRMPILNESYREMAEHYNTAILPARVRKPKDKAAVEGTVGVITTWVIAALRNWKFFTIYEMNAAIRDRLDELNRKPFQKRPGSRMSVFLEEEAPLLIPLPERPFELAEWKLCTVGFNYHITVDKINYSVPHEYIKKEVSVRYTSATVEVFYDNERIASHIRKQSHANRYVTDPSHMPDDHKKYTQWNAERFYSWGRSIGENTAAIVKGILDSRKIKEQGYRACMALLKLAEKYTTARLEAACKKALTYSLTPSFRSVQTILATGQDEIKDNGESSIEPDGSISEDYGFTRGSSYYGGEN
jgi:transposase